MWEDLTWIVVITAFFFVFTGEPDLWDKWHNLAMEQQECKK